MAEMHMLVDNVLAQMDMLVVVMKITMSDILLMTVFLVPLKTMRIHEWFSACWSVQRGRSTDDNVRGDRWRTPSKCPVVQGEPDYRQVVQDHVCTHDQQTKRQMLTSNCQEEFLISDHTNVTKRNTNDKNDQAYIANKQTNRETTNRQKNKQQKI